MTDLSLFAAILLTLRLIAVGFLGYVLVRQFMVLRDQPHRLHWSQKLLFSILLVTMLGNFIPILIDTAALVGWYTRAQPPALGVAYAFSNAITAAVSSFGWWFFYRMIDKEHAALIEKERVAGQ